MRQQFRLAILTCCVLAGCHTSEPKLLTRDALIGNYVYKSEDPDGKATDHELDHLTLQSNGKYDLVQGGSTKPRTEMVGAWSVILGDNPSVSLDDAGYPVRIDGNEIKLLVDDDVGIWYTKTKR